MKQDTDSEKKKPEKYHAKPQSFGKRTKKNIPRRKRNCIDVQDGEDGVSDTEKPPKISTYKFTMADFQEDRKEPAKYNSLFSNPISHIRPIGPIVIHNRRRQPSGVGVRDSPEITIDN